MKTSSLAIVISAVLVATAAYSQSANTGVLKLPQDIEFKPLPCREHHKPQFCTAIQQSREYS
jgi:hypothetical protein